MEEVLEKIENSRPRQITLEDEKKSGGNCAKLYAQVFEKVTNGHQIIMDYLDESITETSDDENDRKYGIKVDFSKITEEGMGKTTKFFGMSPNNSYKQTDFVKKLLTLLKDSSPSCKETHLDLLKHPVIATFVFLKWKKIRGFFMPNHFCSYCLCYSTHFSSYIGLQDQKNIVQRTL